MTGLEPDIALHASATCLCDHIAGLLDLDAGAVFGSLCDVPDNLLHLLASPQGWKALAGFVAIDLGAPVPSFMPTVH